MFFPHELREGFRRATTRFDILTRENPLQVAVVQRCRERLLKSEYFFLWGARWSNNAMPCSTVKSGQANLKACWNVGKLR